MCLSNKIILVQWVDDEDFFFGIYLGRQFFKESDKVIVDFFFRCQPDVGIIDFVRDIFPLLLIVLVLCKHELELVEVVLGVIEHAGNYFGNSFQPYAFLAHGLIAENDDRYYSFAFFGCLYEPVLIGDIKLRTSGIHDTGRVT